MTMRLLGALFATLLTACGAAEDGANEAAQKLDDVDTTRTTSMHGTWKDDSGVSRPASFTLEQHALSAKLVVSLEGHACLAESTVEVDVSTDGISTDANVAGMHLVIEGTPDLDDVRANFEPLKDGPCPNQGGWASLTK